MAKENSKKAALGRLAKEYISVDYLIAGRLLSSRAYVLLGQRCKGKAKTSQIKNIDY